MKKQIVIIFFLLLGVILSGCGSSGGNSTPPSSANLRAAGEQIVIDTREVWGYTEESLLEPKFVNLVKSMEAIDWELISWVQEDAFQGVDFSLYKRLFALPQGDYYIWDINNSPESGSLPHYGTWKIAFSSEGKPELSITRKSVGGKDEVSYDVLTSGNVLFHGEVSYDSALLTNYQADGVVSVNINKGEALSFHYFFNGTYNQTSGGDLGAYGTFNGNFEIEYPDFGIIKYNGSITVSENLSVDNDELMMQGTFETPNLKIIGDIKVSFVENERSEYGYVPNKVSLQGSISSIDNKYSLNGNLTLEAQNAANFNPEQDQSVDNFAHLKVGFGGSFVNDGSTLETQFTLEEIEFERFKFDIVHKFKNGGVERLCTIGISQTDAGFHMDIDSTWGPATIRLDAINDAGGRISQVEGDVSVKGTKVGTIKLDDGLLKVEYNDGSFETF